MRLFSLILILQFMTGMSNAQSFTSEEKLQGYALRDHQVVFIFDAVLYNVKPVKVVVTGSFRDWSQDMEEMDWKLTNTGGLWTKAFDNQDYAKISPNAEFKYRIDEGEWLSPTAGAPNEKGGNLVFEKQNITKGLKAELRNNKTIWAEIIGERPLNKEAYKVTDAQGKEIAIAGILPNTASETLISMSEELDVKRVYFLEIPSLGLKSFCSFDAIFKQMYSPKEMGANIDNGKTAIRIFAPRAELVKLYLYKGKDDEKAYQTVDMKQDDMGVWESFFNENLKGVYYDFTIHGAADPGNHFYETTSVHITDPYARVSDNTWGKARIWERTKPASPLKSGIPAMQDVIAYEVHVQDFTDRLPVKEAWKGTLNGMTQKGLKNSRGQKIGFDYLLDLGINTVHLMPVQEYLHHKDDDWQESFKDDPYMKEQGVNMENYQWGYRTSHCFAIESKYRSKGEEPGVERDEFRNLVQSFHDEDIAVIIDIVPNHTAENMDGNEWFFNFNGIDKLYYYRTKDFDHIGEYGNEVKTENRPMTQRWLIDQCLHFINEFGIDGFRIDLAGQIDEQTLKALKEAIGHDKILYGEPWIGSNDPAFEENPDWDWYKEDSPITFFQDDSRTAYKGPVFELNDKKKDRGWAGGNYSLRENVMKGLSNQFADDKTPLSGISYLDIHDNFALADQFATNNWDGRLAVDQDAYKIAATLLYTTLGPIVTHGGSEIMRSKGMAPPKEVVKETKGGIKVYMHGKRDTYNHRKANQFVWESVGATPEGDNQNDYKSMHQFWKGLNEFRMSKYGEVFRVADAQPEGYYQWYAPEEKSVLGYMVNNHVFVMINAGAKSHDVQGVNLPEGTWKLIGNNDAVNIKGVKGERKLRKLRGGKVGKFTMPAYGLKIWVKE